MLKKELERRLGLSDEKCNELREKVRELERDNKAQEEIIKNEVERGDYLKDKMKQISQSIYTAIQVRYPDIPNPEIGGHMMPSPDCEEKRFLMLIHEMCIDRNYNINSVDDVFRNMSSNY